ncbi:MAG TPA: peptidylprolyl isomerase [Anaerolineaceae bacterium]|nr:peptidylprolyl isomerase [Anaerolineaceae bacterium]
MPKFFSTFALLILLSLVLAACAPAAATPTATPAPTAAPTTADGASDVPAGDPNFTCEPVQMLPDLRTLEQVGLPPVTEADHAAGPEDAGLTLVEYSDFQCPYCALAAAEMDKLREQYPDDVRVVFRQFPLNIHDKANLAAQASEAAAAQDKFWEMHDAIFDAAREQTWQEMTVEAFETWLIEQAEVIGLDADQFAADLTAEETVQAVQTAYQGALEMGLGGTPSFFFLYEGKVLFTPADQVPWDAQTVRAIKTLVENQGNQYDECPPNVIEAGKDYTATVKTEKGDIKIRLFPDVAPLAVNSFVFLAQEDYFDGVTFHRVLPGFVAQTGDPTGTGMGSPGYRFRNEVDSEVTFDRAGLVAMANSGVDSNGSQFFITYAATSQLDGGFTIFGEVIEGMDVVESLTPRDPDKADDLPEGDRITDIVIEEN